jgi:hypothetical protein
MEKVREHYHPKERQQHAEGDSHRSHMHAADATHTLSPN